MELTHIFAAGENHPVVINAKNLAQDAVDRMFGLRFSGKFVHKAPGWLANNLFAGLAQARQGDAFVEGRAQETESAGSLPLWKGYGEVADYGRSTTGGRSSEQVRTQPLYGAFFSWLAEVRRPERIVEFGTAFGVSGMYWLTGLERAKAGKLVTYEPNQEWGRIAEGNLRSVSDRFVLIRGTFEDFAASTLKPGTVDIAFIDAIHTEEFVMAQWEILRPYMRPGAIVLFDDIGFSASMQNCWKKLANLPEAQCSASVGRRLGIVELLSGSPDRNVR